ncbi:hypothetical protein JCM10207_008530 [Rhodosporidiobolus poonsookiae]
MAPTPLSVPSPFFSSRPPKEPQAEGAAASTVPPSAEPSVSTPPRLSSDELRWYQNEDRLVLSVDIGSSFCSVTLAHLHWGVAPLFSKTGGGGSVPAIRTVRTYPYMNLAPESSRMPSLIAYDSHDQVRAIGAEVLLPATKTRAKEEGWTIVKAFKEQLRPTAPVPAPAAGHGSSGESKKLLKKTKPFSSPNLSVGRSLGASSSTHSLVVPSTPSHSSYTPHTSASLSSEGLLDALEGRPDLPGHASHRPPGARHGRPGSVSSLGSGSSGVLVGAIDGGSGALAGLGFAERKKEKQPKPVKLHQGPRFASIYGDVLKHLVACARAWFSEQTPNGDKLFVSLWPSCVFLISHPADWTRHETDIIRQGMEEANLLPVDFKVGRLFFVKEPAAITHFAKRHTKDAQRTWLQERASFALCDAAEHGVSIIGYTVTDLQPKLKLRAYEPVSRLPSGAASVLSAFSALLTARLSKTKFKSSHFSSFLLEEFRIKVLPKFSGLETGDFRLRIQPESGEGRDAKAEKGIDTGAKVRDGWMTLTPRDIEDCFKPSVDAILVRLSSTLPRGSAKYILLTGGFGESAYLVRRLRETFEPQGISLVIPDIPTHAAVSEGSLLFYLSETLSPRRTRFALGVQSAVDWRTAALVGMHEREMYEGSGGRRLILGRWSEVVPKGGLFDPSHPWRKTFNFRYRLAAQDPTFKVTLWAHLPDSPRSSEDSARRSIEGEVFDGWMTGMDGKTRPEFHPVCEVSANLASLVAASEVHGQRGQEWVQLQVDLLVYVGKASLEAAVVWEESRREMRSTPIEIDSDFF